MVAIMQKIINITLKAVLMVLLTIFATGCITDKFDTSKGLQSVMLQVNISNGEMTKAEPTAIETPINTVRIYAYRNDGTQAGHFYRASASDEPIMMDLTLPEGGTFDIKFYVFVNEASMEFADGFRFEENMTQTQLASARFHNVNPAAGFPMYCEQTEAINVSNVHYGANTSVGHEGHLYLVQTVNFGLIRPIAKLSVYAAIVDGGAPGSINIHKVEYQKNGTRDFNYLLPKDATVLSQVSQRTIGREMLTLSATLSSIIDKTDAAVVNNPSNYDLLVADQYLGEVEVGDNDWTTKESDRQAVLHVQYSIGVGGELISQYVYLPSIVRNHHYKVCILINSEGNIVINYFVADWDNADMTELWFDYPSHTYVRIAPNDTEHPTVPATMGISQPFTGYFKMLYPAEETWTPVLLTNATECELNVYKVGEETSPLTYPIKADSENWYKITLTPSVSLAPGTEVEFAITYSPLGSMDKYEYLMINGSQNNPYWPYTGTSDPNKIIIKVN